MSVASRTNGLSADDRSKIRSAILSSREMLESEFERQLERYGVYDDERVPLSKLGHLSLQDRETRREINAALKRELEATEDYQRAYRNYVREATKEYLNRYVGLKTIEARGLVTKTLTTKAEYGNRSYLHYTLDEIAGELTAVDDDGLGVALELAFQEIGAEIRILFEETDYTAIEPEFTVRRDVFDKLDELDDEAWAADEAMGWVYQYFGEKEREEIDDRIDEENYKVQDTDIATKTQLFTPRYIVEWMVDNSLGRLWLEMHGEETSIGDEDNCFYLAPLEESLIDRDVKDVREIKVLDPACGSGHMLFYAFDVLYEMYLERGDVPEKQIPREILKHNLYGIDIDPGAVQIAALSLYVKAKGREPDVGVDQINVISADAVLVNGEKKEEVLDRVDTDIEKRVLEQVWRSFENIREWGSLVRVEEPIEDIIEEELERIESTGQAEFTGDGRLATQSSVVSFAGDADESWGNLKAGLLERVSQLAEEALERNDPVEEMFVGEVEKSVELLDYFVGDYDVVVTNPPYLGSAKMGDDLKQYIKDNYLGTRDAFAAFIQRCWEFAGKDNYATLVTPESYMFLYSYRKLRKHLIAEHQFVEGMHLSRYGFDQQKDAYTIPFVLRNRDPSDFESSRFYRMTHEQDEYGTYGEKIKGLTVITEANRGGNRHEDVYVVDQNTFGNIGRSPFIYWIGQEVLQLFSLHPKLDDLADVKQGLATGDDDRFVRKWWELSGEMMEESYVRFQKSGTEAVYYDIPEDFVLWDSAGSEIRQFDGSAVRNDSYYLQPGLTFRAFGKYFAARKQYDDMIFSHKAHFVRSDTLSDEHLIGVLSSSLSRYVMNGINPGMMFEVGDAKRLPIKTDIQNNGDIEKLVSYGIDRRIRHSSLLENSADYSPQFIRSVFNGGTRDLLKTEDILKADIDTIHGIVDGIVFREYEISNPVQERIYENLPNNLTNYPHIANAGELDTEKHEFLSEVETNTLPDDEFESLVTQIENHAGDGLREISEALEVSPYTVAMVRHEYDLYTTDEKQEAAGRLLSYYLGCIMGRWNLEGLEPDEDGIIVFDENFEDNVESLVRECIELTYGADEVYDRESEIEDMLGKGYVDWLRESFFRYHHCKEYRRRGQRIPIYWQLESDQGAFSCFLYYHAMDGDTLSKLRGQNVDPVIRNLENRLGGLERDFEGASEERQRDLRNEIEEVQDKLEDVRDFGKRLDALINDGFKPDFEAGIWENIQKVDEYDLLQTPLDKL